MVRDQVIVGSGVIASAFAETRGLRGSVVYAAGVSNSACTLGREFQRDRLRLAEALKAPGLFVYFSTCAIDSGQSTPYIEHKIACESMVMTRGTHLIVRMPVVAGSTPNPHTLLNYLYGRIARSEEFDLYTHARRNVIDVRDVAEVVEWLVRNGAMNETVNVATPENVSVLDIVRCFERITGKRAMMNKLEQGDEYDIDTRRIADAPVDFSGDYLGRTLARYYG